MTDLLSYYMKRYDILLDLFLDLRILLRLRENSDPAETLNKIKERLTKVRQSLDRLEQTTKEIKDDKENS